MNWQYHTDFLMVHTGSHGESFSMHMLEEFDAALTKKGIHGWELVQMMPVSSGYVAFFKRPAQ